MAVCPKCNAGVGLDADECPKCGNELQFIPEPDNDPIEAIKEDIEDFVEETAPGDMEAAGRQIDSWRPTQGDGPEEMVTSEEGARPIAVFGAPDEISAKLVTSLLRNDGIDAMLERVTIPMLDTARRMEDGVWGYVLVHQSDAEQAKEIIASYESREDNLTTE